MLTYDDVCRRMLTHACWQQAVLEAFRVFLEEEDKDMSIELRKGRPKSGCEAVKAERVSSIRCLLYLLYWY